MDSGICKVYRLQFPNGKSYLGVSINPERRLLQHARGKGLCSFAISKYGMPKLEVLLIGTREYCMWAEGLLTIAWKTIVPNGYNLQVGGIGGSIPSRISRLKMRNAHLGRKASKETLIKMTKAQQNRLPISEKTRRLQSNSAKKRGMPRHVIEAGAHANRGMWQSQERRDAQSKRMTQWWADRKAGV